MPDAPNAVPDHENPAWLRERAREYASVGCHEDATVYLLLADLIDVCGRDDVYVVCRRPFESSARRYAVYRRGDDHSHSCPTLPAAVRAFLAAEQEAKDG